MTPDCEARIELDVLLVFRPRPKIIASAPMRIAVMAMTTRSSIRRETGLFVEQRASHSSLRQVGRFLEPSKERKTRARFPAPSSFSMCVVA